VLMIWISTKPCISYGRNKCIYEQICIQIYIYLYLWFFDYLELSLSYSQQSVDQFIMVSSSP
jgi:hypothetical protein